MIRFLSLLLFSAAVNAQVVFDTTLLQCPQLIEGSIRWGNCDDITIPNEAPAWTATPAPASVLEQTITSRSLRQWITGLPTPTCTLLTPATLPSAITLDSANCEFDFDGNQLDGDDVSGVTVRASNVENTADSASFNLTVNAYTPPPGGLLVYENFDTLDDLANDTRCLNYTDTNCTAALAGMPDWVDFTYNANKNNNAPTGAISGARTWGTSPAVSVPAGRGGGKAYHFIDEALGEKGQWGADYTMMAYFDANEYPEIWMSIWVKWNGDMPKSGGVRSFGCHKMLRGGYLDTKTATQDPGAEATTVFNWSKTQDGGGWYWDMCPGFRDGSTDRTRVRVKALFRCFQSLGGGGFKCDFADGVQADGSLDTLHETFGATWRRVVTRAKVNTCSSCTDGRLQVWVDGVNHLDLTKRWPANNTSSRPYTGWNYVAVGGNADHNWGSVSFPDNPDEVLKYSYDDLCVGTTQASIELDECGGVTGF